MPPIVLANLDDAGIKDLRHLYRAAVCGQLPTGSPPCDELILRFPNEAAAGSLSKQTDIKDRYQIAFVPGFFSDCLNGIFYRFTDVIADLTGLGFVVHNLPTFGRASSASNAERLAKQLGEFSPDPKPFIIVVYSKGLPDVLELLLRYPQTLQHIAAIISIAGAANGSRSPMNSMRSIATGSPGSQCRDVSEAQARKFETCAEMFVWSGGAEIDPQLPCLFFPLWRCQEPIVFQR